MKANCPYCTKEIKPNEIMCPSCATVYGEETLMITRRLVEETLQGDQQLFRKYDRVPKKFKVTYSSPKALVDSYLFDIGKGGVFIKTNNPLKKRERISLKILLPDGKEELEVIGQVAWSSEKKHRTSIGKYPPGMGITFLNLSAEDKERIQRVLKQPKP
jgi:uncharacterized protein (TIGR02266 family)